MGTFGSAALSGCISKTSAMMSSHQLGSVIVPAATAPVTDKRCSSCGKVKSLHEFSGKSTCNACRPRKRKHYEHMVNSRKEAHQHLLEENVLLRGIVVRQNTSLAEVPLLRHSLAELSSRNAEYVHQEARHREEMARLAKRRSSGSESDDEGSGSIPPSGELIPHLSFEIEDQLVAGPNATHEEQLKMVTAQNTELREALATMKSRVRRLEDSAALSTAEDSADPGCQAHYVKESVPKPDIDDTVAAVEGIPAAFPVVVGNLGVPPLSVGAVPNDLYFDSEVPEMITVPEVVMVPEVVSLAGLSVPS